MANFFSGLAGPLVTQAAQGIGEYNAGQKQARDTNVANALTMLAIKRQTDQDALARALGTARIQDLNAQTQQRGLDPVEWIKGGDGQYYQVPKRQARDPNAMTATGGISGISGIGGGGSGGRGQSPSLSPLWPAPSVDPNAGGRSSDAADGVAPRDPMAAPEPYSPLALFSPPQQAARGTGGIASGIPTPQPLRPLPRVASAVVNGRTVLGRVDQSGAWSPDTTAQGDTVYGRTPANGRGASPLDTQLNHSIVSVRSQIGQTQQQLNAAKKAAAAASGVFATPEQKAAAATAGAQVGTLQQRLDSLSKVHDALIARQQAGIGLTPAPSRSAAPPALGASGLPPEDAAAMQAEFDDASRSLQTVLNAPTATPADKAQARQLYDQQQRAVAQKYSQRVQRP